MIRHDGITGGNVEWGELIRYDGTTDDGVVEWGHREVIRLAEAIDGTVVWVDWGEVVRCIGV